MLTGFLYTQNGVVPAIQFTTNFQDFDSRVDAALAWPEFKQWTTTPKDGVTEFGSVQRIGNYDALAMEDVFAIKKLLLERRSVNAILERAAYAIRVAAERPESAGTIGKQIMSVVLPADPRKPGRWRYDSSKQHKKYFAPDVVTAFRSTGRVIFRDMRLELTGRSDLPLVVPPQSRRQPCACGSGKRYKNCHGQRQPLL
jgi:hypothetical protein